MLFQSLIMRNKLDYYLVKILQKGYKINGADVNVMNAK